jgi:FkbM family methyltransferase
MPSPAVRLYRKARSLASAAGRAVVSVRTCRVRGLTVHIGVASEIEAYRVASYAEKEPETLDWLDSQLRDGDVFMDVGANIGLYSLYAAKRNPQCTVYAVEPESQNFSRLCRNIVLSKAGNVIPCNFALSDREAFDLLYVGSLEPGSALHSLGRPSEYRHHEESVPLRQGTLSVTLDALVTRYGLPQPTLLKVDVDGIEEQILDGAETLLASPILRSILVEVTMKDGSTDAGMEKRLDRFGFRLLRASDWVAELNGLRSHNLIFGRR